MSLVLAFVRQSAAAALVVALLAGSSLASPRTAQRDEPAAAPAPSLLSITSQDTKLGARWSVLCDDVPLEELVRALARKAGLALEGAELLPLGARATVELERRPLEQVLAFVLGGHGLRHEVARGALRLLPAPSDPSGLLRLAQDAWRAVEAEGDGAAAWRAKLAQASLAEVGGDVEGAYRVYAEVAEEDAGEESHEATFRAGRVLERLGHWAEAAQHFRTLAGAEGAARYHSRARLELARVSIELGDADGALHVLNFLDANFAGAGAQELAERRLVRARAFNATHEPIEALRTLEEGALEAASDAEARALEIRAVAFEGLGYEVEAARAWLLVARQARDALERASAFARAAELSLSAGDELGALFVCREAAKAGADERLGSVTRAARMRLGLEEDDAPTTIVERLERAEALLAHDDARGAAELFEGLYLARGALAEPEQARVLAGWSRAVLERSGLEAALEVLSRARAGLADPGAARTLDLAAAALLEDEGRFAEAADAYRGLY